MNKIYSYLGLARRAGYVVSGEQAVQGGVKRGQVALVLIAADASANTTVSLAHWLNITMYPI